MVLGAALAPGPYVCVDVCDQGCGMDPATALRAVEPFFTSKSLGRGLGLSMVLGMQRMHGGALDVRSQIGQGTQVSLILPRLANLPRKPTASLANPPDRENEFPGPPRGEAMWQWSGQALLIDPDRQTSEATRAQLAQLGFTVSSVADLDDAPSVPAWQVVLAAVDPHEVDPQQFVRDLRDRLRGARLVLLCSEEWREAMQSLAHAVHVGCLVQPLDPLALAEALRALATD